MFYNLMKGHQQSSWEFCPQGTLKFHYISALDYKTCHRILVITSLMITGTQTQKKAGMMQSQVVNQLEVN